MSAVCAGGYGCTCPAGARSLHGRPAVTVLWRHIEDGGCDCVDDAKCSPCTTAAGEMQAAGDWAATEPKARE